MPEYPGGKSAMIDYLQQNLQYPARAREKGIEANIITSFVVNVDGSISDIKINQGVDSLGFKEEVLRVIKNMPKWNPGKQNGINVPVYFNLPVAFNLGGNGNAQNITVKNVEEKDYIINAAGVKIYKMVETMPEFPGSDKELVKFLNSNLHYPSDARENKIQGTELVQFVVSTDGSISDITIKNSLSKSCDDEVIRIVKMMPSWKPGVKDGVAVPVYYVLPVSFKLK